MSFTRSPAEAPITPSPAPSGALLMAVGGLIAGLCGLVLGRRFGVRGEPEPGRLRPVRPDGPGHRRHTGRRRRRAVRVGTELAQTEGLSPSGREAPR